LRIFKTRWFARYARRARLADRGLIEAVERAGRGEIVADHGAGIIEQRVARPGSGLAGDFRLLMAYRPGHRALFLYGFEKRERVPITPDEWLSLHEIGAAWLAADAARIDGALKDGEVQEVRDDGEC
jgi:hypothetical protein